MSTVNNNESANSVRKKINADSEQSLVNQSTSIDLKKYEKLVGIVDRVTFHNEENGWTILKVMSFREQGKLIPVVIHQAKVFAGATMEFYGHYHHHPKYGEQFKAVHCLEKKPATAAALEKYLGSGLIKGVGPAIAKRIVNYFKDQTLDVFESKIEQLMQVPGIAEKKLEQIQVSWDEHKAIRDVMIFLQGHGISTLFATKIFKTYGNKAIQIVSENPYRLARDIYGIGFFSADRIALAMGYDPVGQLRIEAGISHLLSASREEGHCFLFEEQLLAQVPDLLRQEITKEKMIDGLLILEQSQQLRTRFVDWFDVSTNTLQNKKAFYTPSIYFDEKYVAEKILRILNQSVQVDMDRVKKWINQYCEKKQISLSDEQSLAVEKSVQNYFSILTGGPGCGKTTTTKVIVQLLLAMKKKVILAAPTGRAAQRMTEVVGVESKTIHRLLEWNPSQGGFSKNEHEPLQGDFLIIDETSMLDVQLTAALLRAVPKGMQVLFIGDPDQLPAVGAGNVLFDLLSVEKVPRLTLTKIFRQAEQSSIIQFAHAINQGKMPKIISPVQQPNAFQSGVDCLFLDVDEATQEQLHFIAKAKAVMKSAQRSGQDLVIESEDQKIGELQLSAEHIDDNYFPVTNDDDIKKPTLVVPNKFRHVDLGKLAQTTTVVEEIQSVLKSIHPWSTIHFGMTALPSLERLYLKSIPEWLGKDVEIQVLSPQTRGTLGTVNLNLALQKLKNPPHSGKKEIILGERVYRVGDRVIQTRNNYDLGVFNGDIGQIVEVDLEELNCVVLFSGVESRRVVYARDDLNDLQLAYAITIHKSQGSEFPVVVIPVLGQHFNMLFRNLIYTGLTRAKKLAIFVGSRKALSLAIQKIDSRERQTTLPQLLKEHREI